MTRMRSESGFSLAELLIATGLLLVVSSIVTSALMQMTSAQTTIWNRTEMHSGIRGATELLQQEVGQAGRIATPYTIKTTGSVPKVVAPNTCDPGNPSLHAVTVTVGANQTTGLFTSNAPAAHVLLTTLDGDAQESVPVAAVLSATQFQACFSNDHLVGTVLAPLGSFATGIIPNTGVANGSTGYKLKMYGDINGDGSMVYVEYTCDVPSGPNGILSTGNLYRNVVPLLDPTNPANPLYVPAKPAVTNSQILLSNLTDNPLTGAIHPPCFSYQSTVPPLTIQGTQMTFVLDVAITLTVETQQLDPITRQKQTETKALLNVSPRNVFNAWMLAGMGYTDRIQSMPATITVLLP